jgi:transposase InsO family protein
VRLPDEDEVRAEIIEKVSNYGRVGYRKVTHMLRNDGRKINHKQVERIWREEGLKLPHKQPRKRRVDFSVPVSGNRNWSTEMLNSVISSTKT